MVYLIVSKYALPNYDLPFFFLCGRNGPHKCYRPCHCIQNQIDEAHCKAQNCKKKKKTRQNCYSCIVMAKYLPLTVGYMDKKKGLTTRMQYCLLVNSAMQRSCEKHLNPHCRMLSTVWMHWNACSFYFWGENLQSVGCRAHYVGLLMVAM